MLAWLAYQSTGVIYGDIGTSPLYVYSSTFSSQPTYEDLVGALSIIIWTLTLMVTIKYVFIVLSADDDGEGGTFALYTLLARYANIVRKDPNVAGTIRLDRHLTGELKPVAKTLRTFIENSSIARTFLKILGVLGVSMVMAGMFCVSACDRGTSSNHNRWGSDSCSIGSRSYTRHQSGSTKYLDLYHCWSDVRHSRLSFSSPTLRDVEDWLQFCPDCYDLALIQCRLWHIQSC